MKRERHLRVILSIVSNFFIFFLLAAFVTTCCITLFISALQDSVGREFTKNEITLAAKITMINVVLISVAMSIIDYWRRKFTVERPVKRITDATSKMIEGDFRIRIEPTAKFGSDDSFNEIIECINKMAEELNGVETLRTDFIANVSHEMKTPLAVIQNYGTLLQSPDLPEEKRLEYAKTVTDASRRLADMMTNILKLNRLENQQIYPQAEVYELGEQLCECLLQYETVWESRNIEINTDIADGVFVCADAELLSLVWNNLFSNAFKFTESGGCVSLSLQTTDEYAVVKVQDTGCGMSPEVGTHIFEKFYQGDRSHATQGNGLGLSLVKRVVDIMQGEIGVESTVGVGTTFTVKIRRTEHGLEKTR
ncbi:MAG: HAMP domain-containing histidine kinase [Clostridia bacterium]|nr:HAMP domain-containing histidine kinase [Clostridia bacterium]MBQ3014192.1 HAMP domain-containing histidine kinase [Clostridia bacterium]